MKVLIIALITSASLFAQHPTLQSIHDGLRSDRSEVELLSLLETVDASSQKESPLFWAESYWLKGLLFEKSGDKDSAMEAYKKSIEYASASREEGETSRNLYYLSASGFALAQLEGLGSIIKKSADLNDMTLRAYELNRQDPEIIHQLAASFAYPPKIFGGDPSRAIELLTEALSLENLPPHIEFDILTTLTYCYEKEKRYEEALNTAERGLTLFSTNRALQERKRSLDRRIN